jgi:hypothetical protein
VRRHGFQGGRFRGLSKAAVAASYLGTLPKDPIQPLLEISASGVGRSGESQRATHRSSVLLGVLETVTRDLLVRLLVELDDLLAKHQVRYDVVVHDIRLCVDAESGPIVPPDVLAKVRGMFGGMGSLTDVFITRANGHIVEDERAANMKLDSLRTAIFAAIKNG